MSTLHAVAIPKWGIEMVEGTVASWLSGEGDQVDKGDEICEIESDKIVNALEAPAGGVLARIVVADGETCKVGTLIGVIAPADTDAAAIDAFVEAYEVPEHSGDKDDDTAAATAPARADSAPAASADGSRRRVSPVIRRLAGELGVDLDTVTGSGRNGRITREDVERAAGGAPAAEPATAPGDNPVTVSALTSLSRTAARRLVEAKRTVPHFYLNVDVELDALLAARAGLSESAGTRITVNDLLLAATARALMAVPEVNARLLDDEIHQFRHADIAIAVATDRGLLTPVLRRADTLSPAELAAASKTLIERTQAGELKHGDLDGGTFTVSNLGMFGVTRFDAIVNPPQVAILALGEARPRPVVRDGAVTTATVMAATLSCDHRVVDGALGARFLAAFREAVECVAVNG
ncbi:MAG: dihydrolipoamide acetyltransferase family protein [Pseudomonadota bacterium]